MTTPVHEALHAAAVRAAADHARRPRRVVGAARFDPRAATAAGRWRVVVDTGDERLGDTVPERLVLVDPAGGPAVHPVRTRSWDGPVLELDCTGDIPASLAATAVGAPPWTLLSEGGRDARTAACDAALERLAAPGPAERAGDAPVAISPVAIGRSQPGSPAHVHDVVAAVTAPHAPRATTADDAGATASRAGRGPVLVIAAPADADAIAVTLAAAVPAGRVVRAGATASRRVADDPRVGLDAAAAAATADGTADPACEAVPTGPAASLAEAQAVLSESRALCRAAETRSAEAAAAVAEAERELDELRPARRVFAELAGLARQAEQATAAQATLAGEVGRLADAVRCAAPSEAAPLVLALARAAESAVAGAARRDALVSGLEDHRQPARDDADRRRIRAAESRAVQARLAERDADGALRRARDRERRANHDVGVLARLVACGTETAAAIDRAGVVVCAPQDLLLEPALGGRRFGHVVIDLTRRPDPALVALAVARARQGVTLLSPA
jgi:hypothetical protein